MKYRRFPIGKSEKNEEGLCNRCTNKLGLVGADEYHFHRGKPRKMRELVQRLHKHKFCLITAGIISTGSCFCGAIAETGDFEKPDQNFIQWAEELTLRTSKQLRTQMDSENSQTLKERKCSMQQILDEEEADLDFPRLMGFISFSMPIETLLELSLQLQRVGGAFVIRGLPGNSFKVLSEKILEMRKQGSNVPILIDPKAFETHNIQHVPTFVLFNGNKFDKIAGNISVEHALNKFAEQGEVEEAKELLGTYRRR